MIDEKTYFLEVDICGQKLTLTSDISEEHIKEVSSYVNKCYQKIRLENKASTSKLTGIMLGLTIADEYFIEKKEAKRETKILELEIEKLSAYYKKEFSDKEKEFVKYVDNISEVENENDIYKEKIKSINKENKDLNDRVKSVSEENKDLNDKVYSVSEENKQLNDKVYSVSEENKQLNDKVYSVSEENKLLNDKVKSISEENIDLNIKIDSLTDLNKELEEKIKLFQSNIERNKIQEELHDLEKITSHAPAPAEEDSRHTLRAKKNRNR